MQQTPTLQDWTYTEAKAAANARAEAEARQQAQFTEYGWGHVYRIPSRDAELARLRRQARALAVLVPLSWMALGALCYAAAELSMALYGAVLRGLR